MSQVGGPIPEHRVLATLNEDGSRRWLKPRLSAGRFLARRRVVAYALIAIFTVLPYIKINGKPTILLNIIEREFTFFGVTFLPTDTLLLAFFVLIVFVTIFLLTAFFGRVWCGWACPQTVYLEFIYRPIERLFGDSPGRKKIGFLPRPVAIVAKYAAYLIVSLYLAHTFLSYFVGVGQLAIWVRQSPFEHPTGFLVVMAVTALMMFDFTFFREQTCLVACPYGRFQSVLLDKNSLIVTYDKNRGEPRGPLKMGEKNGDVSLTLVNDDRGDCINCHMCVTTCPTGIDIRDGLQMECIGCAQCIDACDTVMTKIGKLKGLIRYSTQNAVEGNKQKLIRPRIVMYPIILTLLVVAFVVTLSSKGIADITLLRGMGLPYAILEDGLVSNEVRVKIVNRLDRVAAFTIVPGRDDNVRIVNDDVVTMTLTPGESQTVGIRIALDRASFVDGQFDTAFRISGPDGFEEVHGYDLLGPRGAEPTHEESSP